MRPANAYGSTAFVFCNVTRVEDARTSDRARGPRREGSRQRSSHPYPAPYCRSWKTLWALQRRLAPEKQHWQGTVKPQHGSGAFTGKRGPRSGGGITKKRNAAERQQWSSCCWVNFLKPWMKSVSRSCHGHIGNKRRGSCLFVQTLIR